MNWFQKPTPEQIRERELLRQLRLVLFKNRVECLPLEMFNRRFCQPSPSDSLATNSSSPSPLHRDRRSAANMSVFARLTSALLRAPLNRLRCRLRPWWVHRKRRVAAKSLALLLRLARWSLNRSSRG